MGVGSVIQTDTKRRQRVANRQQTTPNFDSEKMPQRNNILKTLPIWLKQKILKDQITPLDSDYVFGSQL